MSSVGLDLHPPKDPPDGEDQDPDGAGGTFAAFSLSLLLLICALEFRELG